MPLRRKFTLHIISHTHWDREWYLPFETFRSELVDLINELFNILEHNKDFIFHLDGQSIILQDFLEIHPEKKDLLKKYIKSKNIIIGPWYALSDLFLSSGEATIRNLLYGIRDVKEFGEPMMVGYLPDQFGQIAQLPQILKGFNIDKVILGRGIQDGFAEYNWHSLNGDNVLAVCMTRWYNNAQTIPEKNTIKYLEKILEKQKNSLLSNHLILMNGCDHLFAQKNLPSILKKITRLKKYKILQNNLTDALESIQRSSTTFPIRYGELRDDNNKQILSGTLSSRIYLKLQNYELQTNLEKKLEPLASIYSILNKTNYPIEKIKYAWKLLMQNHIHDSICGCSIDDVHREMETRNLKTKHLTNHLISRILTGANNNKNNYLNIINPTSYERSEPIEAIIEIPLGPISTDPGAKPLKTKQISGFKLIHKNKPIDFEILESLEDESFILSRTDIPLLQAIKRFKILIKPSLKPFSAKSFTITEEKTKLKNKKTLFTNNSYNLNLNSNGSIDIVLKNKKTFKNLHSLTIEDDIGDEYNFAPSKKDQKALPLNIKSTWRTLEENKYRKKVLLKSTKKDLDISIELTTYSDSNRIDFKTIIHNKLKNKRIRLNFPTNLNSSVMTADTPFGTLQRSQPPLDWIDNAFNQPLYNFITHKNNNIGISFFGSGLASYELYKDGNGFSIDLIRAVDRLSSVYSHAHLKTPEAQCNRVIEFNYSLYFNTNNEDASQEQLKYQVPVIATQTSNIINFEKLITISEDLILSTFKRSEDNKNLYILRVFNPHNKIISNSKITFSFPHKKIYKLNLDEKIKSTFNKTKTIEIYINPFEVITLGILV